MFFEKRVWERNERKVSAFIIKMEKLYLWRV